MIEILFTILSVLLIASAVGVVLLRNPLHSALSLVLNLCLLAAIYALLEAYFLAAVQIIVYAGAIMVLVLFALMLLDSKFEAFQKKDALLLTGAVLLGIGFGMILVPYVALGFEYGFPVAAKPQALVGSARVIGKKLFTEYWLVFQASGILLLTALIASISILARRK